MFNDSIPGQPLLAFCEQFPIDSEPTLFHIERAFGNSMHIREGGTNKTKLNIIFATAVKALANVVVDDCANSPGPYISLDGTLTFTKGLQARFIFRNNDNPVGGPRVATVMSDGIVLIPTGLSVTFPKQPVQGGVGGNPWISAQWRHGDGSPIGEEVLLGRCEQLSKN